MCSVFSVGETQSKKSRDFTPNPIFRRFRGKSNTILKFSGKVGLPQVKSDVVVK